MNFVNRDAEVNPTHVMSEFKSTILAPSGTERFYSIRRCIHCGAEEAVGNAHLMDAELQRVCEEAGSS